MTCNTFFPVSFGRESAFRPMGAVCSMRTAYTTNPGRTGKRESIFRPNRRMDRPHIIKNKRTGKYVLWLKYCDKAHFAGLPLEWDGDMPLIPWRNAWNTDDLS